MSGMSKLEILRRLNAGGQAERYLSASGYFRAVTVARYVFVQDDPQAVWTVPHNLGCLPAVVVIDETGSQVFADVQFVSDDIVQVTHGRPQAGVVCCV